MSGPNSNLSKPPMFSPNQNSYSPMANAGKLPHEAFHQCGGSPYLPVSSLVSPANLHPTFTSTGMIPVPPNVQNHGYPSPQGPPNTESNLKPPTIGLNNHSPQQQSASPKNPASPYEKQNFVQNGPVSNSYNTNTGQSVTSGNPMQMNGHGSTSNTLFPPQNMPPLQQGQWSTPSRLPSDQSQKLSTSGIGSSPVPHQYPTGASVQSAGGEGKSVPKMSQVPSPGLPMPYGNQNITSPSPLATPGTSRENCFEID